MPSANMRTNNSSATTVAGPMRGPEFNINAKDVEGLVLEIKENLRISASTLKAMPYRRFPKKFLRNSPYSVRSCDGSICEPSNCTRKMRYKSSPSDLDEDPYELLQRLLRDGSLVNEAVRRVQLGITVTPRQQYYYESDEESCSPVLRLCSQEN